MYMLLTEIVIWTRLLTTNFLRHLHRPRFPRTLPLSCSQLDDHATRKDDRVFYRPRQTQRSWCPPCTDDPCGTADPPEDFGPPEKFGPPENFAHLFCQRISACRTCPPRNLRSITSHITITVVELYRAWTSRAMSPLSTISPRGLDVRALRNPDKLTWLLGVWHLGTKGRNRRYRSISTVNDDINGIDRIVAVHN
jgi:hypothetical protein